MICTVINNLPPRVVSYNDSGDSIILPNADHDVDVSNGPVYWEFSNDFS